MCRRSRSVSPRGEGAGFQAKVRARMISALAQSGGAWLPTLFPDATVDRAIAASPSGGTRVLLEPDAPPLLALTVCAPVILALGPEGGLEVDERELLRAGGFVAASLAGNVLRFETAGIAALALARGALAATPRDMHG
jgi:16S rRNA (uracil1498-N3)-methyltransferase